MNDNTETKEAAYEMQQADALSNDKVCSAENDESENQAILDEIGKMSSGLAEASNGDDEVDGPGGDDHIDTGFVNQDEEGEEIVKTFYNLAARCIQHEMDHLEGKLCIDYEKGNYSRDKHKSQTMVESDFRVKSDA